MKLISIISLCVALTFPLFAQQTIWEPIAESEIPLTGKRVLSPNVYQTYRLNVPQLQALLASAPNESDISPKESTTILSVPLPNGEFANFQIVKYDMMEPGLATRYPEFQTLRGINTEGNGQTIRLDWTARGFRAYIRTADGLAFIDPYCRNNTEDYLCYYKKHYPLPIHNPFNCSTALDKAGLRPTEDYDQRVVGDCMFRTYRLAMATTGEYSNYHGASDASDVALVLAEVTTAVNRVNEVYERDASVRMILIANTDDIFYYDGNTDPYTNNSGSTMLGQNQTNIDNVIGTGNYDIGHVFSTGGGGIASLRSPCNSTRKARGVTGLGNPINDPFYIDYVAHEMGHQYGGNHTQNNSCNRSSAAAMEPGSASTIMGYAGICAPNVQSNSDDYFHGYSILEIANFVTNGSTGGSCATVISTANTAPTATDPGDFTIPVSTPFRLTTTGSDVNDNLANLTYCWEQWDPEVGETMPPASTNTQGPMFRTFDPSSSPTRYFPDINDVLAGTDPTWEELPGVSRAMEFRVSVRDNNGTYGCVGDQNVNITTNAAGGAFTVTSQPMGTNWEEGQYYLVEWNKGLTDIAPINCSTVNILLAIDGETFGTTLASGIDNNGKAYVLVPSGTTTEARIIVECADNVFYNVNAAEFSISAGSVDYGLGATPAIRENCPADDAVYTIQTSAFGGYSSNITLGLSGLPAGAAASVIPLTISPGNTATLSIGNLASVAAGTHTFMVTATSASGNKSIELELIRLDGPTMIAVSGPVDTDTDVSVNPTFSWPTESFSTTYDVELATDNAFANIIASTSSGTTSWMPDIELDPLTTYYWRIRGVGDCGNGPWSVSNAFTTCQCYEYNSTDIPVTIASASPNTITSDLDITDMGTISDINVINLIGEHTYVSDLVFTLESPANTTRTLINAICGTADDFDIELNSQALNAYGSIPCPPTDGNTYQSLQSLNNFIGESITGTWTMAVLDGFSQDGGELSSWGLRICATDFVAVLPVELVQFSAVAEKEEIQLYWETATEINNKGFWIERQLEGEGRFTTIGWMDGQGNSEITVDYSFADKSAPKGIRCYYRLRQVDFDGKEDFSQIRSAILISEDLGLTIYPNPVKDLLRLKCEHCEDGDRILIFNQAGQQVLELALRADQPFFDLKSLTPGLYHLKIFSGQGLETKRFIKQ